MKHWKTTLGGLIGSVGIGLTAFEDSRLHIAGIILNAIAVSFLGYHATDK